MAKARTHNETVILQYVKDHEPCSLCSIYRHFEMRRQNAAVVLSRLVKAGKLDIAFRKSIYRGHPTPFFKSVPEAPAGGAELQDLLTTLWR